MVHLDPVPTERKSLGQIQCTEAGKIVSPTFEITSEIHYLSSTSSVMFVGQFPKSTS